MSLQVGRGHDFACTKNSFCCSAESSLRDDRSKLPAQSPDPAPEQGPGCKDFASSDSILGLVYASNGLPSLQRLTLEESPVALADIPNFCDALLGFGENLIELSIDAWKKDDTSMTPSSEYTTSVRGQVLECISKIKMLQKLRVRDWFNLVRNDHEGRVLARLVHLEDLYVGQVPNTDVNGIESGVALPFRRII